MSHGVTRSNYFSVFVSLLSSVSFVLLQVPVGICGTIAQEVWGPTSSLAFCSVFCPRYL